MDKPNIPNVKAKLNDETYEDDLDNLEDLINDVMESKVSNKGSRTSNHG